ncbi:hypothetical protein J2X65_001639 [Ancylobacter sp. 3268]|uniref:hypothetical protein n=1 Tax=Ancylobacter sp. 3268 TaxID=2817752 RepID=UPI00285DAFAD|nr:hypothetical protein [Ancylobacter sp. 3268]MDR6952284.1 hypothetical protein [Ancylobacter sp. 3268]
MTVLGWILDWVPWWAWLFAVGAALAATWQLWWPFWLMLPQPLRVALGGLAAAALAYFAGRNRGASGATERAKAKEQEIVNDIERKGAAARERADRDAISGRLRDDDGFRRDG